MDSACRIGLRSHPHESSDCRVDGLYGGQSCRGGIPKIGKVGECFQWRSNNEWSYGQTKATAGFNALNRSKVHVSRSYDSSC